MAWTKAALAALMAGGAACSSGSGGGPAPVIDLSGGGASGTLTGGAAGQIIIQTSSPGGVAIRRSGAATAAFTVPAWAGTSVDLGTHGVTVATTTTVLRLAGGAADPGAGVLYVVPGTSSLFEADGLGTVPATAEAVTGLKVNAGITVRLAANLDANSDTHHDQARLAFPGDLEVAGTLELPFLDPAESGGSPDRASLRLEVGQLFVRASGRIDGRGGDAPAASGSRGGVGGSQTVLIGSLLVNEGALDLSGGDGDGGGPGGQGGSLHVLASAGAPPTTTGGGVILNAGSILLSGGDGASGGPAGGTNLVAPSYVVNTGRVVQQGGAGRVGAGGGGAVIQLVSYFASVVNAGTLVASGGDGIGGGGAGGYVEIVSGSGAAGDVVNSGTLTLHGGDGLGDPSGVVTASPGGAGGVLSVNARGSLWSSGPVTVDGGAGHGAVGGPGGDVLLLTMAGTHQGSGSPLEIGPIQLSGAFSARGGTCPGGTGGRGGRLQLIQTTSPVPPAAGDAGIEVLGYERIVFDAGDGSAAGGALAAPFMITVLPTTPFVPSGSIGNEVDISGRSGSGTGAAGASGSADAVPPPALVWMVLLPPGDVGGGDIVNSGRVDVGGGSSTGSFAGGGGAGLLWRTFASITNSGRILCRGGDAQQGRGGMGAASGVMLVADRDIVNAGVIDATPGAGASGGTPAVFGSASFVRLLAGRQVRNSAAITIPGGRATDASAGVAGSGGLIELFGETVATQNTGTCNVAAGTGGTTAGRNGAIWIDAIDRTPASGVL